MRDSILNPEAHNPMDHKQLAGPTRWGRFVTWYDGLTHDGKMVVCLAIGLPITGLAILVISAIIRHGH